MKKRVLVTGGAGFIGSYICERLIKDGNYVICCDKTLNSIWIRGLLEKERKRER